MAPTPVSSVALHIRAGGSAIPSTSGSGLVTTLILATIGVFLVLFLVVALSRLLPLIWRASKEARACRRQRAARERRERAAAGGRGLRARPNVRPVSRLPHVYPHPAEPAATYWQRLPRQPLAELPELPRRVLQVRLEEAQLQIKTETGAEDMYLLLDDDNQLSPVESRPTAVPSDCFRAQQLPRPEGWLCSKSVVGGAYR